MILGSAYRSWREIVYVARQDRLRAWRVRSALRGSRLRRNRTASTALIFGTLPIQISSPNQSLRPDHHIPKTELFSEEIVLRTGAKFRWESNGNEILDKAGVRLVALQVLNVTPSECNVGSMTSMELHVGQLGPNVPTFRH